MGFTMTALAGNLAITHRNCPICDLHTAFDKSFGSVSTIYPGQMPLAFSTWIALPRYIVYISYMLPSGKLRGRFQIC
jgi:hypothetical protein